MKSFIKGLSYTYLCTLATFGCSHDNGKLALVRTSQKSVVQTNDKDWIVLDRNALYNGDDYDMEFGGQPLAEWIHPKVTDRLKKDGFAVNLFHTLKQNPHYNYVIINALKLATVAQLLYDYADTQAEFQHPFIRGSFSIEDRDEVFFSLLQNCAQALGDYYHYKRDPRYKQTSHYTDAMQYGVDLSFSSAHYPVDLLPHGMHHILFGSVYKGGNDKATFVKCEQHGLKTWSDALYHGQDYLHTLVEHTDLSSTYREKDLPFSIRQTIQKSIKQNNPDLSKLLLATKPLKVHDLVKKIIPALEERLINETLPDTWTGGGQVELYQTCLQDLKRAIRKLQGGWSLAHIRTGNECVVPQAITDKLIAVLQTNKDLYVNGPLFTTREDDDFMWVEWQSAKPSDTFGTPIPCY